jgi:dipeptidyl aminopeptidase/acylaminoacyl peptidase
MSRYAAAKSSLTRLKQYLLLPFAFLLLAPAITLSQGSQQTTPPGTEIFIADLQGSGGELRLGKLTNITRRPGYDNQPKFLPDSSGLLYTSIREDKQADIYRYDIEKGVTTRVTETAESEYSPTVTPDGKSISVIQVEADSTQRLWKFPLSGGKPILILEKIKPVGYHVWVDEQRVVLFILGTPNTLQLVDVATEKTQNIASGVGRSLHRVPNEQNVSFVHKLAADQWIIKELDTKSQKTTAIIKMLSGSEDYAWTPRGELLMATGAKLFKFTPGRDRDWQEIADFSKQGLGAITRLAVSPKGDRVAFVANETP